ncbi:MAG: ABC transporter ATP-binding protein [Egibacteraceae bacterium]
MIRLEELTKRYPGLEDPAVDRVTMAIPKGEIVVLVGPSGCGKTTTMKMINRIIEPTSGSIFLEGKDVTRINPDDLRRRIGYVIQQIGLFPHKTIADNIATVPKLLGWDKQRVTARVDELLETVGMDPGAYRNRYPKELSGGQRQRIGVARAMAGDPPVMLMDEPFGAIDPITRERLQNEFLRLQAEIKKTIIFVTHDIDEAIKMGDRIAILRQSARIAQFDTPETILTAPADDFVADFIGSGASLKRLNLSRVRDVELEDYPTAGPEATHADLRRTLDDNDRNFVLLLDGKRKPTRWVNAKDTASNLPVDQIGTPVRAIVEPQATLADALNEMLTSYGGCSVVVDKTGAFQGVVTIETITEAIKSMRSAAAEVERAKRVGTEHQGTST